MKRECGVWCVGGHEDSGLVWKCEAVKGFDKEVGNMGSVGSRGEREDEWVAVGERCGIQKRVLW